MEKITTINFEYESKERTIKETLGETLIDADLSSDNKLSITVDDPLAFITTARAP